MSLSKLLENFPIQHERIAHTKHVWDQVLLSDPHGCVSNWELEMQFFSELFRKNPHLPGVNSEEVFETTLMSWFDMERRCLSYNLEFDKLKKHPKMKKFFSLWSSEVRRIMGKAPSSLMDFKRFKITSGATTNVGTGNTPLERFANPECTRELFNYLSNQTFTDETVFWPIESTRIVSGSSFKTVLKTALIGRVVQPEPCVNAYFQGAIGLHLQKRLRRSGVNLTTAPDWHALLAEESSVSGYLATEDLSSASALIYTRLVERLVSPQWFLLLDVCRSKSTEVPHSPNKAFSHYWELQQFATMGNGFCFELETIIFLAMLRACCRVTGQHHLRRDCYAYGDDMIYPACLATTVKSVIKAVGFISNPDKSFHTGHFRESCGGHFINGYPVKPVHIKSSCESVYDLTIAANLVFDNYADRFHQLPRIFGFWCKIVSLIPDEKRLWCTDRTQSSNLHGFWDLPNRVDRWKGETRKVWFAEPRETTSIGQIIHKGVHSSTFLRLVCGHFLRGYGLTFVKTRVKDSHPVQFVYEQKYKQIKAVGSPMRYRIVDVPAYGSPLVDEENPLSVFDILDKNKVPCRLVGRCSYTDRVAKDKRHLLSQLCRRLYLLSNKVRSFDAYSIDGVPEDLGF